MAYKDNKHTKHGSAAGAAWILVATVIALLVLTVLYWSSDHNDTASKNSGSPTQTTGSAVNSRATAGSDTSSTGRR